MGYKNGYTVSEQYKREAIKELCSRIYGYTSLYYYPDFVEFAQIINTKDVIEDRVGLVEKANQEIYLCVSNWKNVFGFFDDDRYHVKTILTDQNELMLAFSRPLIDCINSAMKV
jgi:hypothetical protein